MSISKRKRNEVTSIGFAIFILAVTAEYVIWKARKDREMSTETTTVHVTVTQEDIDLGQVDIYKESTNRSTECPFARALIRAVPAVTGVGRYSASYRIGTDEEGDPELRSFHLSPDASRYVQAADANIYYPSQDFPRPEPAEFDLEVPVAALSLTSGGDDNRDPATESETEPSE